jgi:tripartite motif-containing protein 71
VLRVPAAAVRISVLLVLALAGAACTVNDEEIALIGSRGFEPGEFFAPAHIAVDGAGFLYVADTDNHRVQKLTADGEFVDSFGAWGAEPGQFLGLSGLAVAADGAVYTVEFTTHRVQKFTADGAFLAEWGERGRANGAFIFPSGLVVDDRDRVYVADRSNYRIQVIAPDGTFEPAIAAGYVSAGRRAIIGPLAWAPGSLYTADAFHHVVLRHDLAPRTER